MATVTLKGSGKQMPLVGFGLWKLDKATASDTVYEAIKAGYRLLDGACDYGNEKEAGQGLKRAIDEGIVTREEMFITSKLWNTFHAREHVIPLAKKQLADWGLDYFDLFLIHFPISLAYVDPSHRYPPEWKGDDDKVHLQNTPIQETWEAMEQVVRAGLARDIGLSNFNGSLLCDVLRHNKIPVSVLQIEHHPYLTQEALVSFAKSQGIAITGYCSFGPQSWVELSMAKNAVFLLTDNETIASISKSTGRTPAQVLLRWATQRGVAVIPKSNKPHRAAENFQCLDFDLSAEQINEISSLNINLRFNNPAEIDERMSIFA